MSARPKGDRGTPRRRLAAKVRPGVVMSVPLQDPDRALVTVVPHTTTLRGTRFEMQVPVRFLKPGAFDAQGIVTVPTVRLVRHLGTLSAQHLEQVAAGARLWLGLQSGA